MTILDILTYPDHFLRNRTQPVKNIDGKVQEIIADMSTTMYDAPGTGLAAIQVGIDQSILIYDLAPREEERSLQVLINPRIVTREGEVISENEGCLSVPEYRADVKRAASVLVEGYDQNEKPLRLEAHGFHAIVLQHEIDHLEGTLFIDRISALKRQLYKKRVKKWMKNR
jgi:peptide deformylase